MHDIDIDVQNRQSRTDFDDSGMTAKSVLDCLFWTSMSMSCIILLDSASIGYRVRETEKFGNGQNCILGSNLSPDASKHCFPKAPSQFLDGVGINDLKAFTSFLVGSLLSV
jgi:hypothetical protein